MATTLDTRRETASLVGSDKVEGTLWIRSKNRKRATRNDRQNQWQSWRMQLCHSANFSEWARITIRCPGESVAEQNSTGLG